MTKQREILLVPFPFSDQSGKKVRPVLVLSNDEYNQGQDLIVCAITSNLNTNKYSITIDGNNLESGNLYQKSLIKADGLLKISNSLIIKSIGVLSKNTFHKVSNTLKEIF